MLPSNLEALTGEHIRGLEVNNAQESKTLEFKEQLPGTSDGDRKEFLADICAFANSGGGDIVYGVRERRDSGGRSTGCVELISGVLLQNADAEVRRLENLIRDGIAPRVAGIQFGWVEGFASGGVFVIRIPASWSAPHMVTLGGASRFYARNNAGKYQLDVGEIRTAFSTSESMSGRVRSFRVERMSLISSGEGPHRLPSGPKVGLHLLPLSALEPTRRLDVSKMGKKIGDMGPLYASSWNDRFNFDGYSTFAGGTGGEPVWSYVQLFRNGTVEAVDTRLLSVTGDSRGRVPIDYFERLIVKGTKQYLRLLENIGVPAPCLIFVTLFEVEGFTLAVDSARFWPADEHLIDRRDLPLPEALVESYKDDIAEVLRSTFDALWQSAGYSRSFSHADDSAP